MIPQGDFAARFGLGFPRVSGDDPVSRDTHLKSRSFSPRERG